jgi:serine/threonine protein kinase
MELVRGGALTDVCDPKKPMPEACIAYVCAKTLMALAFMHKRNHLHRYLCIIHLSIYICM